MARLTVHELREKSKADLLNQLKDLKAELALLHVALNKLSKKATLREAYKNKNFLPIDLRPKKTRAI